VQVLSRELKKEVTKMVAPHVKRRRQRAAGESMENKKQKIIIFGYSHCGTSILKSIVGHIDEVYEVIGETKAVGRKEIKAAGSSNTKHILIKWPILENKFLSGKAYKDYIKIFIVRNPLWVYSSLNRRYNQKDVDKIVGKRSCDKFIYVAKQFVYYRDNPQKNLYLIRYEDMFKNNYQYLRELFDSIGFNYTDQIFNNCEYVNRIFPKHEIPTEMPDENNRAAAFRTYQINQPFVNNNHISKIDLSERQKNILINDKYIREIYPDIESVFLTSHKLTNNMDNSS